MTLDCLGQRCPLPVIALARAIGSVEIGEVIRVLADDPAAENDIAAWCRMRGHSLVSSSPPEFEVRRLV
ncbi:MAG TPA: sulfurtransferase TusA family protein [Micromonosporaceae bacterium]|jgi:tRNA 2-thiouridine synthesizing protein A